jgi:Brp/Blh family beta-carotene 15,15'-monooxygenase
MDVVTIISLLAVVLIGLPHGAMDGAVALAMGYGRSYPRLAGFLTLYVLIAIVVVMFWLTLPEVALFGFLLLSVWHFGSGDSQKDLTPLLRVLQSISHGGLIVFGISIADRDTADLIFSWLIFGDTARLWHWIDVIVWFWLPCLALYVASGIVETRLHRRFGELAGLAIMVAIMPALTSFAIYFCLIHTPRHMTRVLTMLKDVISFRLVMAFTIIFTVMSWLAGGLIFLTLYEGIGIAPASMMVVFIGLAALTVPHSLLIDGLFRPRFEKREL